MARLLALDDLVAVRAAGPANWSADGRRVAFVWPDRDGTPYVWVCSAEGGLAQRLSAQPAAREPTDGTDRRDVGGGPRWSPREPRIAFVAPASADRGTSIWTCAPGDPEAVELTHHVGDDRSPRWAPDGSRVAFITDRDSRDDLQVVPAGGGLATQLTYDRFDNTDLDWSPDGRWLAFSAQRSDEDPFSNNLCVLSAAGGDVRLLTLGTTDNDRSPRWSPDSRQIAFISNRSDTDDLWLIAADGSDLHCLSSGRGERADPQWSPDGQWLTYTQFEHGDVDLWLIAAGGGEPRRLTTGGVNRAPRWSPDGARLLYIHSSAGAPPDLWALAPFGDVPAAVRLTNVAAAWLDDVAFCSPRVIDYISHDGAVIEALLYQPPAPNGAGLVWVHGGPNDVYTNGWEPLLQYLVQRGYTVIAPNYRGSTGYGKAFMEASTGANRGVDVHDWIAAANVLRDLTAIDPRRLGIIGHSAGGHAALLTLGVAPDLFAVGVARSAPTNWLSYWEHTRVRWTRRLRMKLLGLPVRNEATYRERSPITYAGEFCAPVLLLHGEQDAGVPASQAIEMSDALAANGKAHECHVYPSEGHELAGADAIADSATRIERFLANAFSVAR